MVSSSGPAWLSDRAGFTRKGRRKDESAARFTRKAPRRPEVRHARCAQPHAANPKCFGQQERNVWVPSPCRLPRAMDLEPAVQTHGLPASHCFWFSTATMSPAPPAAFTSRGDRWQARASCLTFPHAAGAMDKIQASTDRSVGRRHELVNRTNENILYKRPMSRAFSAATILMGSNRAFTSLPAQTNRRRQPSRP